MFHAHTSDPDLVGKDFLEFLLAYFDTNDFPEGMRPNVTENYEYCRYAEFRTHPKHETPYKRPDYYWKILAARLAFIIIFQNFVAWLQQFIDWSIPDKPAKLDSLMKREKYLVSKKIINEERQRVIHSTRNKLNEIDYVNGGVFFEAKS